MVNVELPPAVTALGFSEAVGPEGLTTALKLTVPAKPLVTAVLIMLVPLDPCAMLTLVGEALIEKLLAGVEVGVGVGVGLGVVVALGVGVGVGLGVVVGVGLGVGVGVGVGVPPQLANLNEPMRVLQLNAPLLGMYSLVYQNVQSSDGSTVSEL